MIFDKLIADIAGLSAVRYLGRVAGSGGGVVQVRGLSQRARMGDRVVIGHGSVAGTIAGVGPVIGAVETPAGRGGEVVRIGPDAVTVLTDSPGDGIALNDPVTLLGQCDIAPDNSWIGRIVDPFGAALDGLPLSRGRLPRALRPAAPTATRRGRLGGRLDTGMTLFNTLLPLVAGQRIGLFAGSGVGKSTLLGTFAREVPADVVVVCLIGERGRELREFVESVLQAEGMARAIVVAATADQSPLIRRRCAWAAMAVAEHFRDQGGHVLLLMDSITRFAEAHREIALAGGEPQAVRGFPPSSAHMITALTERAGPGLPDQGMITAVFSVLVAGSDMEEPIADIMRGVLDGHIVLDRTIAERGRFPAVDILRSVSRSLPAAATPSENQYIAEARRLLGAYDRAELMIQAGLYEAGTDPLIDRAIKVWPALDAFAALHAPGPSADSFPLLARALEGRLA
ncbi:FliI/YscN family ATPase [Roseicitreum antarcticum]|uniref:Flagellum-specific ATP synthase n=1 Tax=Roseicitreum antarcticum TaxID=564137 RepID=A0A1H3A1S2_9RHOB|nr:FliI/YscN family ATPase [Roseicitreum antarcticum]SDX23637.1 flagellum-specific ATP synthase [Roseicitreum antarcticum]